MLKNEGKYQSVATVALKDDAVLVHGVRHHVRRKGSCTVAYALEDGDGPDGKFDREEGGLGTGLRVPDHHLPSPGPHQLAREVAQGTTREV